MDIDYDDFLAMFPMTQERPFSKEELAALERREASVIAQASLYGHRVKGLPKSVMLTNATKTKPRTRRPG